MKYTLIILMCMMIGGCQFAGTIFTGVRKVTTILMDDRSFSDDVTDTKLNIALRDAYIDIDPKLGLDIEVTVFEGAVLLTGAIPDMEMIQKIIETTWKHPDTKRVYNYIRLSDVPSIDVVNQDAAISGALRTQITFAKSIKSSNYKLVMENGVVYIMGLSENTEELQRVITLVKDMEGVSKVVTLTRMMSENEL